MKKGFLHLRKVKMTLGFVISGFFLGLLYPVASREYDEPVAMINGLVIGLLGSLFLSLFELYLQNPLNRKMPFARRVLLKTLVYACFFTLLILAVYSLNRSIYNGEDYWHYLQSEEFVLFIFHGDFHIIVAYTLAASALIIFTHQLSNKVGQGVFLNLIFGKYHEPRIESRIFMFLDLNNSTSIAERMGAMQYNRFLNAFFHDITEPILQAQGEIYRYVGDEVVVSWSMKDARRNLRCIHPFFAAVKAIGERHTYYQQVYGETPRFSAALHCGQVVVGQLGDVKSQVVFNGRVLYEGALIEKHCRTLQRSLLVSERLMGELDLSGSYISEEAGLISYAAGGLAEERLFFLHNLSEKEYL